MDKLTCAFAICALAAQIGRPDSTPLAAKTFNVSRATEVGLEIEARSLNASWGRKRAEAAALTVFVDGAYDQDLLLWAGDAPFTYRVSLGRLHAGKHTVRVLLNSARSSPEAKQARIISLRPLLLDSAHKPGTDDFIALAHSPVLYARANSIDRFTDTPLLMYYEAWREAGGIVVRYTVIFSHEDGGTPTAALMARWGRTTDIEWVYQFRIQDGKMVERIYQGVEHETKTFRGNDANGDHPLLAVASNNNNFSDLASSAVRFALLPVRADLGSSSRESVMDLHPWTYRVMAEELGREKRISDSADDLNFIADPRDYIYVEAFANQKGTAVAIEASTNTGERVTTSDLGNPKLRISRSGYFRAALRLPSPDRVGRLAVRCLPSAEPADSRACERVAITKALVLDRNYMPRELQLQPGKPATLKPGEAASFHLIQR
jgi:hypothetical protein